MRNQPHRKATRKDKVEAGSLVNKRMLRPDVYGLNDITLTETQKVLANKIIQNDLVVCSAPSGTGKTLATLHTFVKMYLQDSTKQIIVIRTPVESGLDKIGFLPNDLNSKLEPHFASAKMLLGKLLSKGKLETDMDHRIHFKIPNYMLGSTMDNTLLVIDECQEIPPLIMKLLLERVGENSKVVVLGDPSQRYTMDKGRNGLTDVIDKFFTFQDGEHFSRFRDVDYHSFDIADVQRSEFCKTVLMAYA